uniref:BESS domain-containing protein n=1 Tax=Timema douglasi TaxID=61478 RepID=A0A7R8VN33_TIMDO|nr:unnamed protein product [Timema douglasi]
MRLVRLVALRDDSPTILLDYKIPTKLKSSLLSVEECFPARKMNDPAKPGDSLPEKELSSHDDEVKLLENVLKDVAGAESSTLNSKSDAPVETCTLNSTPPAHDNNTSTLVKGDLVCLDDHPEVDIAKDVDCEIVETVSKQNKEANNSPSDDLGPQFNNRRFGRRRKNNRNTNSALKTDQSQHGFDIFAAVANLTGTTNKFKSAYYMNPQQPPAMADQAVSQEPREPQSWKEKIKRRRRNYRQMKKKAQLSAGKVSQDTGSLYDSSHQTFNLDSSVTDNNTVEPLGKRPGNNGNVSSVAKQQKLCDPGTTDTDLLFLQSLLTDMKKLTDEKKFQYKMSMMENLEPLPSQKIAASRKTDMAVWAAHLSRL